MPIEAKVEEVIKKNNGVIPMEHVEASWWSDDHQERIRTEDGTYIDLGQLRLLFWEFAKDDMPKESIDRYLKENKALDLAVYGNIARVFWYRDHARDFNSITDGRKFCKTFAMQILYHPEVKGWMAAEMHDIAMDVYRRLGQELTDFATDSVALTTPET
jgi:hypothetical protein